MPRRVGDFRGLTHLSRLRLLHAVQRLPGRRLAELAAEAGLHPNTAREHLAVLENEGLVESRRLVTGTRGRPPIAYHPVEDAQRSEPALRRAEAAKARGEAYRRMVLEAAGETGETPAPEAEEAGAAASGWVGRTETPRETARSEAARHQLDTLYEHLDDAGFEPSLDEENLTLGLVPCRYFAVMDEDERTVCAVHVRLIRQHLAQVPGPVELRRVQPFVTPESCVVTLGLAGGLGGPGGQSEPGEGQGEPGGPGAHGGLGGPGGQSEPGEGQGEPGELGGPAEPGEQTEGPEASGRAAEPPEGHSEALSAAQAESECPGAAGPEGFADPEAPR
jgi:predicted ArsR family transcriptional regulator